ncbi:hypothetical protein WJX72_003799 [[Myrmecia] bisecta]|uniref:t-SNARE coiled-coil homology domain-containing protein n=1 Tax=[Myrmecia] bisecta TaxID=41462 RepID=A0AAW1PY30_9CHLO
MAAVVKYEQEKQLDAVYADLKAGFKKLDTLTDTNKQNALLKDLTNKMQEAKTLIKEFEREARMDGMSATELGSRKKNLVQELNNYIGLKKAHGAAQSSRQELMGGASGSVERGVDGMTTTELMAQGRKEIKETDDSLMRAQQIVEKTIIIGTQTAETLHAQTKQLENVADDLDEIHFSMDKARKVIRDITRGIATDKCIMFLLLAAVAGVVVCIVLKVAKVGKANRIVIPEPKFGSSAPAPSSRRLLGYSLELLELLDSE